MSRLVKGVFKGIGKRYNYQFADLKTTPYLYDSGHLTNLYHNATDDQLHDLREYLERFEDTHEIFDSDSYANLYIDICEREDRELKRHEYTHRQIAKRKTDIAHMRNTRGLPF